MAQQIESKDIKLYASEKLNDANDGGGRVTANEIESGQINNVFQDISRVDHANGSVELRKLFMGIRTNNNAPLLGAHMLVVEPPLDPNVTTLIFQTPKVGRETDTRVVARDYLEHYYIKAAREFVQPLGLNVEMSNTLTLFAALTVPVNIKAGDTIVLFNSTTNLEEFVKIQSISVAVQSFVYQRPNTGDYDTFEAKMIRCQLVSPLQNTWDGGEARPNGVEKSNNMVFSTIITDAARYRGATKLTAALSAGETVATVENVLQPLVPVARQEVARVNRNPYTELSPVVRGTDADEQPLQLSVAIADDDTVLYMPTAVTRRTMIIDAGGNGWFESGSGSFAQSSGAHAAVFSIDYSSGILTCSGAKGLNITIRYLPAAALEMPTVTTGIPITQSNLGLVYTFDLSDLKPEPSTIRIEYMAAGDWLTMNDDGNGLIVGQGNGLVDYVSGQIQVTLDREPEVGSYILLSYLPPSEAFFERQSGQNQAENVSYDREIIFGGIIMPGTLIVKKTDSNEQSTDDGKGGITGDAGDGIVAYANGSVILKPTASAYDAEYEITAETSNTGKIDADYVVTVAGSSLTINLGRAIKSGTLYAGIGVQSSTTKKYYDGIFTKKVTSREKSAVDTLIDDGDGNVRMRYKYASIVGTINYTTGVISLPNYLKTSTYTVIEPNASTGAPSETSYTEQQVVSGPARVKAIYIEGDTQLVTKTLRVEAVKIKVTGVEGFEPIIPRSLWLRIEGNDYFDDGEGKLIGSYSTVTGAGVQIGNVDYVNGLISMQSLSVTAKSVQVKSLVTMMKGIVSDQLIFAIKDRPLRHASFQMNVTTMDDTIRRYQSDESGNIKVVGGTDTVGFINVSTGVVTIDSSELGGSIESRASVLGSLRYNAVKSESLPVDPDIVGLNVQRLPIDGRVPIFKLGDTVVLNHADFQDIPTPTAGETVTIDRDHLAEVAVLCDGVELDANQYEIDLEVGQLTFSDPLTLQDAEGNPLAGDWQIKHRIEHMTLTTRVQQNGQLTLQVASAHNFPVGATASSALLFGDLQADVGSIFTQRVWQTNSPNWTDKPDSSGETTARYDTINYPIMVSNESAVTDRWALVFRGTNSVDIVSENLGVIATAVAIGSEIAPINPVTNTPYFVVSQLGWGGGWATGNALRFNTDSALAPFWLARTVTPAQGITESDGFVLSPRGDSQ